MTFKNWFWKRFRRTIKDGQVFGGFDSKDLEAAFVAGQMSVTGKPIVTNAQQANKKES